ncbi:AzlD domain-containing protein [Ursidibacter arcticus]
MDTLHIIYMLIALTLGTQLCRFLPFFLPKNLMDHPVLQKLNRILPLVIMALLLITSVSIPQNNQGYPLFSAQVLALVSVVISYKYLNNILLSVALGILNLNLLLWLFS